MSLLFTFFIFQFPLFYQPWEEKVQGANESSTLTLLENLYPSFSSSQVEVHLLKSLNFTTIFLWVARIYILISWTLRWTVPLHFVFGFNWGIGVFKCNYISLFLNNSKSTFSMISCEVWSGVRYVNHWLKQLHMYVCMHACIDYLVKTTDPLYL